MVERAFHVVVDLGGVRIVRTTGLHASGRHFLGGHRLRRLTRAAFHCGAVRGFGHLASRALVELDHLSVSTR